MAKNVSNNQTLEEFRQSYNNLVDEVGGLGTLRTSQKGSLVDAVNSIIDQYFFFQDFEYDGSDGTSSNRTFSGNDNFGESLKYSVNRVLVFKNGVLLRNGTEYSATNGTSITLASSAANSDIIRITSFTGSYEGVAGATQGAVTQWTKTGAGSIYNHDTEAGVVINSDDSGIVTAPASGYGIQLESTGSNIYLNTGSTSNKVFINGDLDLASGAEIQINGSKITSSAISGFNASARGLFSGGTGISYNSSTGQISATGTADTTGNAGTATALETARTIHGVSFDGTANIDLTEQIQDTVDGLLVAGTNMSLSYNDSANTLTISSSGKTQEEVEDIVGAMFSSNTETGITATYQDSDGTIDLVIGNDAIVSSMIADNTIVGGNIAANTIGSSEIAANAINASELADDAVDTDAIVDNAVTLGTKTSGNYVANITAGTALSSTGATSGEGTAHTLSLDDTAVTAGSYGSATAIPTFTVDAQGRLTAASTVAVDTYSGWSLGGDTGGAGSVPEGTTINIVGGEGIDTAFSGSTLTVAGELASTTNKGVASFNDVDFSVSSGVVSLVHEHIEDIVGGMLTGGGATSVTYNDATGNVTISSTDTNTDTNTQRTDEEIRDVVAAFIQGGSNVSVSHNDSANTFTITATNTQLSDADVRSKISGTGLIGYNASTGVISTTANNYVLPTNNVTGASVSGNVLTLSRQGASNITFTDNNTTYTAGSFMSSSQPNIEARFSSLGVGTNSSGTAGEIRATNDITAYFSDERLKDIEGPIPNAIDKVMSISGYYYRENETAKELGYDNDNRQVGVSAQEVQAILPEVVTEAPIDDQYLTVHYDKLVPLLIESIKELKREIESLKS